MQIKKDSVRDTILKYACEEFYKYGFEKASLRKIAGKSSTTIGNIYTYFQNKAELFQALMDPVYNSLIHLIDHHNDGNDELNSFFDKSPEDIRKIIPSALEWVDGETEKKIVILLEKSGGTKYADVRSQLARQAAAHYMEHLKEINRNCQFHPYFPEAAANGLISGILHIIQTENSPEEKKMLLADYFCLYFVGGTEMFK